MGDDAKMTHHHRDRDRDRDRDSGGSGGVDGGRIALGVADDGRAWVRLNMRKGYVDLVYALHSAEYWSADLLFFGAAFAPLVAVGIVLAFFAVFLTAWALMVQMAGLPLLAFVALGWAALHQRWLAVAAFFALATLVAYTGVLIAMLVVAEPGAASALTALLVLLVAGALFVCYFRYHLLEIVFAAVFCGFVLYVVMLVLWLTVFTEGSYPSDPWFWWANLAVLVADVVMVGILLIAVLNVLHGYYVFAHVFFAFANAFKCVERKNALAPAMVMPGGRAMHALAGARVHPEEDGGPASKIGHALAWTRFVRALRRTGGALIRVAPIAWMRRHLHGSVARAPLAPDAQLHTSDTTMFRPMDPRANVPTMYNVAASMAQKDKPC